MTLTYFKRFRMELNLSQVPIESMSLPVGFQLLPWHENLMREHAKAKWESFHNEIDSNVFPCLGDKRGCLTLMRDISARSCFVPQATWLLVHQPFSKSSLSPIGTVQGLQSETHMGAIQNLGIISDFRGLGLGTALLFKSLQGFIDVGCQQVELEVTVQNTAAIRLYQRHGFRRAETVFKVAEVAMA